MLGDSNPYLVITAFIILGIAIYLVSRESRN